MASYDSSRPGIEPLVKNNLNFAYISSSAIALLMVAASVAGILYQSEIYPTDELVQSFLANDVVTLVLGVPILLGSMFLAGRGVLLGLLFWPGALFFAVYNYITYVFAMLLSWWYLVYLLLLALSLYTMIALVASINASSVKGLLTGNVPERLAGGILIALSLLFLAVTVSGMVMGVSGDSTYQVTELALNVSDFLVIPCWLIGGVLLWRRRPLGYVGGTGLLFQGCMMFVGLLIVMVLSPLLTGDQFGLSDYLQIIVYSLIAFVPFGLFVRGVIRGQSEITGVLTE